MDLPTLEELKVVAVDIVTCARDNDQLHKLSKSIVRQQLEKHFSLDEDALDSKEYKAVIKDAILSTLEASEQSHAEVKPKTSKKDKTTRKEKEKEMAKVEPSSGNAGETETGSRKRRPKAVLPDEESLAEGVEASESEAPSSKKVSARSRPSKMKSEKPAKSRKKPESENKYKSKAFIESSEDEDAPKTKATLTRSPKKAQASPKSPSSKHKQSQQKPSVKKADPDVDMDDPSTSALQLPVQSPKSSKSKKQEPVKDLMESEFSSVIDEPPKKRQKKQEKGSEKPQKEEKQKRGKKEPLSKDEETVNKLKGIVVACGIRKVWKKEFESLDKPSQQIKRLHQILGELGMTPRYSLEKAKSIREKRELAQELKDVQEFEKATQRRGREAHSSPKTEASGEDSDGDDTPIPARKKQSSARASIMAFLQDQSDEE